MSGDEKKNKFLEAMKASRELLTTSAIQHEKAMKKILYDKDEPRRRELTSMSSSELKSLAKHYAENSSHSFNFKSIKTKNKLIEKIIAFENSIDTNPDLQYGNEAGKKNRKHTRKRRRTRGQKRRQKRTQKRTQKH